MSTRAKVGIAVAVAIIAVAAIAAVAFSQQQPAPGPMNQAIQGPGPGPIPDPSPMRPGMIGPGMMGPGMMGPGMMGPGMMGPGMMGPGMMGPGMMGPGMPGMCPVCGAMMGGMCARGGIAATDKAVYVLVGNQLMKYNSNLVLVKTTEIKVDVRHMHEMMQQMMRNCPMRQQMMQGMKEMPPTERGPMVPGMKPGAEHAPAPGPEPQPK
jgi:hypothetical protein